MSFFIEYTDHITGLSDVQPNLRLMFTNHTLADITAQNFMLPLMHGGKLVTKDDTIYTVYSAPTGTNDFQIFRPRFDGLGNVTLQATSASSTGTTADALATDASPIAVNISHPNGPGYVLESLSSTDAVWASQLLDSTGVSSVLYFNRQLNDSSGVASIDWLNRLLINDGGFTTVNYLSSNLLDISGNSAENWQSRILFASDGTTEKVNWENPASTVFNSASGVEFVIGQGAAPVANYLEVNGAISANSPLINAQGSDSDVSITFQTKGLGAIDFTSTVGAGMLLLGNVASSVNNWEMSNSATGNAPTLSVGGSDTNVSMELQAKGTGYVQSHNPIAAFAGLRLSTAANGRMGTATLVGGTIAVANTSVTANTLVFLTRQTVGGTLGFESYTTNAGVGFTINNSSALDTSTFSYVLFEPA